MAEKAGTDVLASSVYVVNPVGAKEKWVAEGKSPVWSPDRTKIAYCVQHGRMDYGQIRVVNADGTGERKFTNLKSGACDPAWSPDGKQMAVTLMEHDSSRIAIVSENGELVREIGDGREPRWSPDGKKILLLRDKGRTQRGTEIWVVDADGSGAKKILDDNSSMLQAEWLPNGVGVLFSSNRDGMSAVYTMDSSGGNVRKLASNPKENWHHPQLSPDGQTLVVEVESQHDAEIKRTLIVQIDLPTHKSTILGTGFHASLVWAYTGH